MHADGVERATTSLIHPDIIGPELAAGATVAVLVVAACLASGVLAYAPLGPGLASRGAMAGLYGAVFGAGIAALVATSSFVSSTPRASVGLVCGSLSAALVANPAFAAHPDAYVPALSACVLLAGLLQVLYGVLGIGRIISFAPYPVLAGFLNGVGLVIIISQVKALLPFTGEIGGTMLNAAGWAQLGFAVAIALVAVHAHKATHRVSGLVLALLVGVLAFYLLRLMVPAVDLGETIGNVAVEALPVPPLWQAFRPEIFEAMASAWTDIVVVALTLSIVATLESLLSFRVAQNLSETAVEPRRDLAAQGVGNAAAGMVGGLPSTASPSQIVAAFQAGGRTRLIAVSAALMLLALAVATPSLVAGVPKVVLSGILFAIGAKMFDPWTVQVLLEALRAPAGARRARNWSDFGVAAVVMLVTVGASVVAGVIAGVAFASMIFIVGMSRPVVRRRFFGHQLASKRMRSVADTALLTQRGERRAVLELQGVLFFGNADSLANAVRELFRSAETITLDLRGIADIDVSGAEVLRSLAERSAASGRRLLFCNIPRSHADMIQSLAAKSLVLPDLDTALEWVEERELEAHAVARGGIETLTLPEHDLVRGLGAEALGVLEKHLRREEFAPGATLCVEGEKADSMWLLMSGSVSVRLRLRDGGSRRIASLGTGTVVGDLAFIEAGTRSAMVVADDHVACYVLERCAFEHILANHAAIASTLLSNLVQEVGRRLRRTSDELRHVTT